MLSINLLNIWKILPLLMLLWMLLMLLFLGWSWVRARLLLRLWMILLLILVVRILFVMLLSKLWGLFLGSIPASLESSNILSMLMPKELLLPVRDVLFWKLLAILGSILKMQSNLLFGDNLILMTNSKSHFWEQMSSCFSSVQLKCLISYQTFLGKF